MDSFWTIFSKSDYGSVASFFLGLTSQSIAPLFFYFTLSPKQYTLLQLKRFMYPHVPPLPALSVDSRLILQPSTLFLSLSLHPALLGFVCVCLCVTAA